MNILYVTIVTYNTEKDEKRKLRNKLDYFPRDICKCNQMLVIIPTARLPDDGQLTSRSRLEPVHIVSQGRVPILSGYNRSRTPTLVLDICMHAWLNRRAETVYICTFNVHVLTLTGMNYHVFSRMFW